MIRLINGPVIHFFVDNGDSPWGEETGDERIPIYRQQLPVSEKFSE
jgi:hypothetical protein